MEKNILSPAQMSALHGFQYNKIATIDHPSVEGPNDSLVTLVDQMKPDNEVLQMNVNHLQRVADTVLKKPVKKDPEHIESIHWNHYFYKKYTYQIRIILILLAVCVVMNVMYSFLPQQMFSIACDSSGFSSRSWL